MEREAVLNFLPIFALILFLSKLSGNISARFGQPAVFGELLAGLIFGPSMLNIVHMNNFIALFSEIGVIFLMFFAGLQTELKEFRSIGWAAFSSASFGVILPLVAGTIFSLYSGFKLSESIFVGAVLTATSVSISAQTLMELGKLRSKVGMTILGAAIIDDILGIIILSLVIAFELGRGNIYFLLFRIFSYLFVATLLAKLFLKRYLDFFSKLKVSRPLIAGTIVLIILYSWTAEVFGSLAAITGSYLLGVMVSFTEYNERISDRISTLAYSIFAPIFFFSVGLYVERGSMEIGLYFYAFVIFLIAILTKIIGCGFGALVARFSFMDSLRVGVGMISRGEVAIIIATIGLMSGVLSKSVFSVLIVVAILTTVVTPILLKAFYRTG
ncbi:Kef-type K+ transport system, membrane component KefB [Thermodesulfobium acidiphilum]|uniref:Kef-type K+ transport system, membrane component KefB n=1 Tax=Thermodesulfobium acidiphilum TaxID=1794699 RepID=A0A2R4VZ32_THEAF|nr:cation:proton antiporter [Thermodesulfobium acidiphilum]AWB09724.1 Kef-type K+ transport system, membrane component KefB [Thermodesulfobium acidiphilum]